MGAIRLSRKITAIAFFASLAVVAQAAVNILPKPSTMTAGAGTLTFGATDVVAIYRDAQSDSTLPWVEKLFRQVKIPTSRAPSAVGAKIAITMQPDAALGKEGYKLSITASQVVITAPTLTGQFYAVQTLRQMFPPTIEDSTSGVTGPITLDLVEINDKPRFEYRGVMLDPVRHYLPLPYFYQTIDRMALYKLNRLHLLLSNDQGFRIESKVFPKLHELGSPTQVGGGKPPAGQRWYYTQDEMRAIVKYAAHRKIVVIPEIDMPGHVGAIVFCYPELGTYRQQIPGVNAIRTDEEVQISSMHTAPTNPNRPLVLSFISKLWREMTTIFPSDQYQMGGDEWNFNTTQADFQRFVLEVQDTLTKIGKRTIAWDEVKTVGGLRPGNWSQDWHKDANNGDIMSSCNYMYLDHHNELGDGTNAIGWCDGTNGVVSLQSVYVAAVQNSLKGVEGTVFSERLTEYPKFWDRQIWPRLTAVAEVGWVPLNNNFSAFAARLGTHGSRLSRMGIQYWSSAGVPWQAGPLNPKMTSLYDGFVPTIIPDITGIRRRIAPAGAHQVTKGKESYSLTGRLIRFTPSGYPESVRNLKRQ